MNGVAEPGSTVSKFQIIEGYLPISPNKCMCCGAFYGTFVDFGLNDDWYGAVYFCFDCVRGMATELGYIHSDEKDKLVTKIEEYVVKIKELEEEKEKYKNALAALGTVGIPAPIIDIGGNPVVVELSDEGKEQPKSDPKSTRREKRSPKQNDVRGSSGVSDDDGIDQFISI